MTATAESSSTSCLQFARRGPSGHVEATRGGADSHKHRFNIAGPPRRASQFRSHCSSRPWAAARPAELNHSRTHHLSTESESDEEGNVNQCIAAGRMPDCDY